jgi:peptidoglycan/LPS O-acetylase OafA/YrhL
MDYLSKVILPDPGVTAIAIYGLLTGAVLLSMRRFQNRECFLSYTMTQQLKGIAILVVMLDHLAGFVLEKTNYFCRGIAPYGVAIFILLSGFGIMRSHVRQKNTLKDFVQKRIRRIFIPYWIATIFFIGLDYAALNKTYPVGNLLLTFLGINLDATTQSIDGGIRWFITYILLCYGLFLCATCFKKRSLRICTLIAVPTVVCLLNLYFGLLRHIPNAGVNPWNQYFLLFPAGCLLGLYYDKIETFFAFFSSRLFLTLILCLGLFAICFVFMQYRMKLLPYLPFLYTVGMSINLLLFIGALLLLFMLSFMRQFYSQFFMLLGFFSFEIFLLHVVFMSKYKHLFHLVEFKYSFAMFLAGIILLSYFLKKLSKYCEGLLLPEKTV